MSQVLQLRVQTGSRFDFSLRSADGELNESELAGDRAVVLRDAIRSLLQRVFLSQPDESHAIVTFMLFFGDFDIDSANETLAADALLAIFRFCRDGPVGPRFLEKRIRLTLEVPHATQKAVDLAISVIAEWSPFIQGVFLNLPADVEWHYDSKTDGAAISPQTALWELGLRILNPLSPEDNWHMFPDIRGLGKWLPMKYLLTLQLDNVALPSMRDIVHHKLPQLPNLINFTYTIIHRSQMSGLRGVLAFCFPSLEQVTIELRVAQLSADSAGGSVDSERDGDPVLSQNQRAMEHVFGMRYQVKELSIWYPPPGAALRTAVSADEVEHELAPNWLEDVKIHRLPKIDPDAVQLPLLGSA